MRTNKRGFEMGISAIVMIVIVILIFVVLAAFFLGTFGDTGDKLGTFTETVAGEGEADYVQQRLDETKDIFDPATGTGGG